MLQFLDSLFPVRYAVLGLCDMGFMLKLTQAAGCDTRGRSPRTTSCAARPIKRCSHSCN